jgi:uncharacterized protein (TIGR03790 family)
VINTADPLSTATAAYYIKKRHIPAGNVARISFNYRRDELPNAEFTKLKEAVDKQLDSHVQAYALTWARPYRVGCMSITSAFAFGVDAAYCADSCAKTKTSPYYNTSVLRPYDELHMRPAMSIAAFNFPQAKALIDRGSQADSRKPSGTAYLIRTGDPERNVRSVEYPLAERVAAYEFDFKVVTGGDQPKNAADIMFYFTGTATVTGLAQQRFVPGAVADHLTSFGGMLTDSPQMSSLRWLEAGATGSYGTVVEPCNFLGKFPNVPVLMAHYLAGETLIEAYWKSVQMPGQGLFIGEPLAAPFQKR